MIVRKPLVKTNLMLSATVVQPNCHRVLWQGHTSEPALIITACSLLLCGDPGCSYRLHLPRQDPHLLEHKLKTWEHLASTDDGEH